MTGRSAGPLTVQGNGCTAVSLYADLSECWYRALMGSLAAPSHIALTDLIWVLCRADVPKGRRWGPRGVCQPAASMIEYWSPSGVLHDLYARHWTLKAKPLQMVNPSAISLILTSNYNAVSVLPSLGDIRMIVLKGEREKNQNNNNKKTWSVQSAPLEFRLTRMRLDSIAQWARVSESENKWAHN